MLKINECNSYYRSFSSASPYIIIIHNQLGVCHENPFHGTTSNDGVIDEEWN
jgi:hypothetical protein